MLSWKVREKRVFCHSGQGKSENVEFEKKSGKILKIRRRSREEK